MAREVDLQIKCKFCIKTEPCMELINGGYYPHLNLEERRKLAKWLEAKIPVKEIADNLQRAPSTIYREIRRNYYRDDRLPQLNGYHAVNAQDQYDNVAQCIAS